MLGFCEVRASTLECNPERAPGWSGSSSPLHRLTGSAGSKSGRVLHPVEGWSGECGGQGDAATPQNLLYDHSSWSRITIRTAITIKMFLAPGCYRNTIIPSIRFQTYSIVLGTTGRPPYNHHFLIFCLFILRYSKHSECIANVQTSEFYRKYTDYEKNTYAQKKVYLLPT